LRIKVLVLVAALALTSAFAAGWKWMVVANVPPATALVAEADQTPSDDPSGWTWGDGASDPSYATASESPSGWTWGE
jgi:hypothetical protein